jgi:hypothetical protein
MKSLFKVLVLCLCLLTAVSFAYAGNGAKDGSGPNDNIGTRVAKAGHRRGKGYGARNQAKGKGFRRGLRDGKGPINRAGTAKPNYVDANGDGICDNFPTKLPSK